MFTRAVKALVLAMTLSYLSACGVKAPPVAPQRAPVPPVQNLDCSPQDPSCDKTDPKYQPRRPGREKS